MTTEYEAITEREWKDLATTEITHLTDEEKDYLPRAWDAWLARVRRDAKAEALRDAARYFAGGLHCADMRTTPEETVRYLNHRATEYETGDQA